MALSRINELGKVIAHQAGCESFPGGEETCIYGIVPGIIGGTSAVLVKEMYKGGDSVHVVSSVWKNVCLEGSMG